MKIKEIIVIVFLYIFCLYLWTLPIQKNRMPFGEPDGANFFGLGDWMGQNDRPIWELPQNYLMWRYGDYYNSATYPGILWYPPPFHTNLALIQIIGGERILPILLFLAITNSLIVIAVYFLLRKLFDFWSAIIASFLLIFSFRDYITYLWGQWPTLLSFSFVPIILYCYYKYTSSYLDGNIQKIYSYILPFLLVSQYLLHPVGLINMVAFLIFYSLFLIIKYRKLPFSLKSISFVSFIFLFLIFILAPVHFMNTFVRAFVRAATGAATHFFLSNFLHFSIFIDSGYPPFWFEFNRTIGPWWLVPFLLIGVVFLLLRRKKEDLLLLSWFFGLYIFLQFLLAYNVGRYVRNLIVMAHIFYPLIALGVIYLVTLIPINIKFKKYIKYGLIFVFVILIINSTGKAAYETLKGAYGHPLQRLNDFQYEAAEWMKENLKEDDDIFDIYSSLIVRDLNNVLWFQTIAQRQIRAVKLPWQNNSAPGLEVTYHRDASHVLVDYSRLVMMNAGAEINKMQEWEKEFMQNETLLYNRNNIRIYKLRDLWYKDGFRNHTCNYLGQDTTKLKRWKIYDIIKK